jgi:hypothetical protein
MAVEDTTSTDQSDAVDTSVNSEDTSSSDDGDLEDIEVDLNDIQDTDEDEASEEDTDSENDTTGDEDSTDEAESEDDDAEPELTDEQRQAQHNKEMFEQRQREKQARIDKVRTDQQEFLQEAADDPDPLVLAVRQIQVNDYNNRVEATTNKLTNGYEKALNDFPVLKTNDPVIQSEIDAAIDAFQAQHVRIDEYGNAVEVRGDLYATLQAKADSIEKLTGIRVSRQAQSKGKEKSKTLLTPTRAPKEPKVDPDMEAFDEEADW